MTDLFSFGVEKPIGKSISKKGDVGDTGDDDSEYDDDFEDDEDYDEEEAAEEVAEEPVQVGVDSGYWNEASPWINKCKADKENFTYRNFDYWNKSTLAEQCEYIGGSSTLERPFKGTNDSYGGAWGSGGYYKTKEQLDQLRADLIAWKTNWLSMPYCREKGDEFMVRSIRAENIKVFFSNKAKEFIKKTAEWDVDELIKELDALPDTQLTPEIEAKIDEYAQIKKDGKAAQDKLWKLEREMKEAIEGKTLLNGHMMALKYDELQDLRQIVKRLEQAEDTARKERGHYFI
jgi:hypothetical protein